MIALLAVSTSSCSAIDELSDSTKRDSTGEITESAEASVDDLKVGDCFDEESMGSGLVDNADTIPCAEEHTGEVYAEKELPAGEYPTDMSTQAQDFCSSEFEGFLGVSYDESDEALSLSYLTPMSTMWEAGDRTITCLIISDDPITGSLKGTGSKGTS